MKKMKSLFQKDYEKNPPILPCVQKGCEWVLQGEGRPTQKIDGTSCLFREGIWYKRYDRKVTPGAKKRGAPFTVADAKSPPVGWEPCESTPDPNTGHWPGWVPVTDSPEDKWHREALEAENILGSLEEGTYELIGPKVQGNPYHMEGTHRLIRHGFLCWPTKEQPPRDFEGIREWLRLHLVEGVVWHHPDGRMAKVKRSDYGFPWPEDAL